MRFLTVYLFLPGLLTLTSAAAHEGLPLLAPGGIGGIFKGPDSETIIQGPDGSVITSEQEGGAVVRGNGLDQPIVVAESVQDIESDHAIEQVLIQEQPREQSEIAQDILLKTVPVDQRKLLGQYPVLTEIKQSPFEIQSEIENTATIQQTRPILLKEAAATAESSKLLVEPIRQPLLVSRIPVLSALSPKFSISNLESSESSTAVPLRQSTAVPSSTPGTIFEASKVNFVESDKINLGDLRNLNRGLPSLEHRSSNGLVGNPELILNENLVSVSDVPLRSPSAAGLNQAKDEIKRIPLERYILADERLDIEKIGGGQIFNPAQLVNSQPIPLGRYILSDEKSVIPKTAGEETLSQVKSLPQPIPLNQYVLMDERLENPKITGEQIIRSEENLGRDYDHINRVRRSAQRSRKRKQSYYTLNGEESVARQMLGNDKAHYSEHSEPNDIRQPPEQDYYHQIATADPSQITNQNRNVLQEYYPQNTHTSINDQQYSRATPLEEQPYQQSAGEKANSNSYYGQEYTGNAQIDDQRLQKENYLQPVKQNGNLEYGSRIQSLSQQNVVHKKKYNDNYQSYKNARADEQSPLLEQSFPQPRVNVEHGSIIQNYKQPNHVARQEVPNDHLNHQTQYYLTSAEHQGNIIGKQQGVINVQVESDSATQYPENIVSYRTKTLTQSTEQLPAISQDIRQETNRLHLPIPEAPLNNYYQQEDKYSEQSQTNYYPDTPNYDQTADIRVTGNVDYQSSPYAARYPTMDHIQSQSDAYSTSGYRQPVLLGPGDHLLPVNLSFAVNPSAVPIRNLWYIPGINISITTTFAPSVSPPTTIATDLVSPTSSPFNISSDYYIANNARSGNLAGNAIVSKKLFAYSTGQVLLRNLTDIGGAILGNLTYPPPTRSPILKTTRSPFQTTTQRNGLLFSVIRSIAQIIG